MKSWLSKASTGIALLTACGALNSCRLFGGGKYASQMEVETDVPESLEQGRASAGPDAGDAELVSNPAVNGVPPSSNLIDIPDPSVPYGQLPPLPSSGTATTGGASLVGLPSGGQSGLIDIPKPDFNSISVHNTRPPAEMLSLGPPKAPASRMSMAGALPSPSAAPAVVTEKVEPMTPAPAAPPVTPTEAEIASAPKATPSEPAEPGVPLLFGQARLSDFYSALHQPLLSAGPVVENVPANDPTSPVQDVTPSPDDSLSVPPPPPPPAE